MQLIRVVAPGSGVPKELGMLADEFEEDPYCSLVLVAVTADSCELVSVWSDDVARDVESGLSRMSGDLTITRSTVVDGLTSWRL